MKNLIKNIYEHLKTRKKYNRLEIYCESIKEDLVKMTNERDAIQKIRNIEYKKFEETLEEYVKKIAKLKEKKK